jgi:hypothetical protein
MMPRFSLPLGRVKHTDDDSAAGIGVLRTPYLTFLDPKGATQESPGHRPGSRGIAPAANLKGSNLLDDGPQPLEGR